MRLSNITYANNAAPQISMVRMVAMGIDFVLAIAQTKVYAPESGHFELRIPPTAVGG